VSVDASLSSDKDHTYGGIVRGASYWKEETEDTAQMEQRKEEMWAAAMEAMQTGWVFLQGIGAPKGITLAGPNLTIPEGTNKGNLTIM